MSWVLLAALLAQPVQPLQQLDAPLADNANKVVELKEGAIVPFDVTCMDKPQALNVAKEIVSLRAENQEMKQSYVRPLLVVGAVVVAVGAGVALGYGVSQAVKR